MQQDKDEYVKMGWLLPATENNSSGQSNAVTLGIKEVICTTLAGFRGVF